MVMNKKKREKSEKKRRGKNKKSFVMNKTDEDVPMDFRQTMKEFTDIDEFIKADLVQPETYTNTTKSYVSLII